MIGPGSDKNGKIAIEWYKSDPNTLYGLGKCIRADSANAVSCGYADICTFAFHIPA